MPLPKRPDIHFRQQLRRMQADPAGMGVLCRALNTAMALEQQADAMEDL
jgi:hypothetical protein